jgi:hypothetical protein
VTVGASSSGPVPTPVIGSTELTVYRPRTAVNAGTVISARITGGFVSAVGQSQNCSCPSLVALVEMCRPATLSKTVNAISASEIVCQTS